MIKMKMRLKDTILDFFTIYTLPYELSLTYKLI